MKTIAILGSTGYIGKSLAHEFAAYEDLYDVHLFSRSQDKVNSLLQEIGNKENIHGHTLEVFFTHSYDVIINCTGAGDSRALNADPSQVFEITEEMDNLILSYLEKNKLTKYINLSSGAVYGANANSAVTEETPSIISVNNMRTVSAYYTVAKANAEAKHRALSSYAIVDLRVFAFFSRFVDEQAGFLMSDVVHSLLSKKTFTTVNEDMVRDFITPQDLYALIARVIESEPMNDVFDVYSVAPVSKLELLPVLAQKYGLTVAFTEALEQHQLGITNKKEYYSKNMRAEKLGYVPIFSSLEGICHELDKMNL